MSDRDTELARRFEELGLLDHEAEKEYEAIVLEEMRKAKVYSVDLLPDDSLTLLLGEKLRLWPVSRSLYSSLDHGLAQMLREGDLTTDISPAAKHLARDITPEIKAFIFSSDRAEDQAEATRLTE